MINPEQLNQGRRILNDWCGEGGVPVPPEQAQARANVCLHGGPDGTKCPRNYPGSWLWNVATSIAIQTQMTLRRVLQLKLEGEENLGVCESCGCKLQLKVHAPFQHIYRHTPDQQFEKYPDFCWQKKEYQQVKQNINPS